MTTEKRRLWLRLAAAAVLALPACTLLEGQAAADSEEILAQAGFQRHPLDEPGLPARHLVEGAGTYKFKFADPDFCQCVYLGGAKEYAELQRLRAERLAEREWIIGRSSVQGAPVDRTVWSSWKPTGLDAIKSPATVTTDTAGRSALH